MKNLTDGDFVRGGLLFVLFGFRVLVGCATKPVMNMISCKLGNFLK